MENSQNTGFFVASLSVSQVSLSISFGLQNCVDLRFLVCFSLERQRFFSLYLELFLKEIQFFGQDIYCCILLVEKGFVNPLFCLIVFGLFVIIGKLLFDFKLFSRVFQLLKFS